MCNSYRPTSNALNVLVGLLCRPVYIPTCQFSLAAELIVHSLSAAVVLMGWVSSSLPVLSRPTSKISESYQCVLSMPSVIQPVARTAQHSRTSACPLRDHAILTLAWPLWQRQRRGGMGLGLPFALSSYTCRIRQTTASAGIRRPSISYRGP